jgi:hypothetical protein
MKKSLLQKARNYHKWPALIISIFLVMFAISGIIMNHRKLFSACDVNRTWLPDAYRLENWNLASIRSEERLNDGSRLLYGNTGIWKSDSLHSSFKDFNQGLGRGMDNRKVRIVRQTPAGTILAGTLFGLYEYSAPEQGWKEINLPSGSGRIQDIVCREGMIIILTRSELLFFRDDSRLAGPVVRKIPAPEGYDGKMSLFRFAWIMHSGELAGITGRLFLDLLALVLIFLAFTGFIFFIIPKAPAKIKQRLSGLNEFRRENLRLHNKAGAWLIVFLVLVPLTGMFLRPPFLITIANARIRALPLKTTGKDNPWEDKLRAMVWSAETGSFILAASDGFYFCDSTLSSAPRRATFEPPVSVMGINVFEAAGEGSWFVGSFDGLYKWNPSSNDIVSISAFTETGESGGRSRRRTAAVLVSGMISSPYGPVIFDYDKGAVCPAGTSFPPMPGIVKESPMALWNVAQEIHTGRIYQPLTGPIYILIVPLVALLTILVLVTGYFRWRKIYRKSKNINTI